MADTTRDLTDAQILAALAVAPTAAGAAAVLSNWTERKVTAGDMLSRIAASPRLQRTAAYYGDAQTRGGTSSPEDRIRALAGPRRWRERRSRK
jgi:hypothetical protein